MDKVFGVYEQIIIRPPRAKYSNADLGPSEFQLNGVEYVREEVLLENRRGFTLVGSLFRPLDLAAEAAMGCVVYCHANASSRVRALEALEYVLSMGYCLFAFDFAGCGNSEGPYISLGHFEQEDVAVVVEYLKKREGLGYFALWGRSMGSVAALLYVANEGASEERVRCVVADGPFKSIIDLANDLVRNQAIKVPQTLLRVFAKAGLGILRKRIIKKAHFDIAMVRPIDAVPRCKVPALICVAEQDELVPYSHCIELSAAYGGGCSAAHVQGGHNDFRPLSFWQQTSVFFFNHMHDEQHPCALERPLSLLVGGDSYFVSVQRFVILTDDPVAQRETLANEAPAIEEEGAFMRGSVELDEELMDDALVDAHMAELESSDSPTATPSPPRSTSPHKRKKRIESSPASGPKYVVLGEKQLSFFNPFTKQVERSIDYSDLTFYDQPSPSAFRLVLGMSGYVLHAPDITCLHESITSKIDALLKQRYIEEFRHDKDAMLERLRQAALGLVEARAREGEVPDAAQIAETLKSVLYGDLLDGEDAAELQQLDKCIDEAVQHAIEATRKSPPQVAALRSNANSNHGGRNRSHSVGNSGAMRSASSSRKHRSLRGRPKQYSKSTDDNLPKVLKL